MGAGFLLFPVLFSSMRKSDWQGDGLNIWLPDNRGRIALLGRILKPDQPHFLVTLSDGASSGEVS